MSDEGVEPLKARGDVPHAKAAKVAKRRRDETTEYTKYAEGKVFKLRFL
jgi:hypothetical protein